MSVTNIKGGGGLGHLGAVGRKELSHVFIVRTEHPELARARMEISSLQPIEGGGGKHFEKLVVEFMHVPKEEEMLDE